MSAGLIRNFSAVVAALVTGSDGLAIDDTAQPRKDAARRLRDHVIDVCENKK